MKRIFLAMVCSSFVLAASARDVVSVQTRLVPPATAESIDPIDAPASEVEKSGNESADRHCLQHTGSRIIRKDADGGKCANATGRAYTRDDLDRTGTTDLADALRRLDPAIR